MPAIIALFLLAIPTGCRPASQAAQDLGQGHWFRPTSKAVISSPVAYDFDGDDVKEIAVGSWDGYFYLLDSQLNDRPGWPKYSPKGYFSSPALADLDGDSQPEIIVGSEAGKLFAWHADGRDADGFPVDLGYKLWASPTVLDGARIAVGSQGQMFVLDARLETGGRKIRKRTSPY